jgi:hypothetical protein
MASRFTNKIIEVGTTSRYFDPARWPTIDIRKAKLEGAREILNKLVDRAEAYGQVITWEEEEYEVVVHRARWDGKMVKVREWRA